jgi:hypothetical protein
MEEKIIYDVEVKGVQSIENLTKANKELREERKKLDLQSEQGQKRAQEINKRLDENTNIIKENSSALEKNRLNVGNYTESINKSSLALDKMVPGLSGSIQGIQGMTTSSKAFIATPIGAILGALGLILAGVTKYLTGSAEGQDKLNKLMSVAGAIVGKLSDALAFLGEYAIKGVVEGFNLLIKGLNFLIPGFQQLVDLGIKKVNEALGDPAALAALKNRNDVLERELVLLKATSEARIAELKLKAEDKSLDLKTRQQALKDALQLQTELTAKQQEFAANKLSISQQEHAQSNSTKEDLLEEKKLEAELILLKKDAADKSKEIFTKEQELRTQLNTQLQETLAIEKAIRHASGKEANDEELTMKEGHQEAILNLDFDFNKRLANDRNIVGRQILAGEKERNALSVKYEEDKNKQMQDLQNQAVAFAYQVAGKSKALQTGLALLSTYFSAQKAFESQFTPVAFIDSPVRGAIAAGLAVAQGLFRVAQINKIKGFAMGGKVTDAHGTKINRSNGDNILATVKTGEVILNERQQAMLGGDATFRRMGVPGFASGGIVSASAKKSESISFQMQLYDAISRIQPVVTVEDINAGVRRVNVIESRAQVI